ncbi:hypothetical protein D9M68_782890 [compost metagenome]
MRAPLRAGKRRKVGELEFARGPDQEPGLQLALGRIEDEAASGQRPDRQDLAADGDGESMPLGDVAQVLGVLRAAGVLGAGVDGRRTQLVHGVQVGQAEGIAMEGRRDEARLRRPAQERFAHAPGLEHPELQPRHLLQRQGHADAGCSGAHHGDIQAMHYAFLFLAPPWRALKRGLDLQIT